MKLVAALLLALLLGACGARFSKGPELAASAGWPWRIIPAGGFQLATATRPGAAGETLTLFLEGDGLSYMAPNQPALDPTPTDPVALRLALAHPAGGAVAWLGRPCQYTMAEHGQGCTVAMWTQRRYAPEVLASTDLALDRLKAEAGASRLILVGYSGGGALAILLAARRDDVAGLVTVAANPDLGYWTSRHRLAPLVGSLDPATVAPRLGGMPQLHFTGAADRITGTEVVRAFLARLPPGSPARLAEQPGFDHACCWAEAWPRLAQTIPFPAR